MVDVESGVLDKVYAYTNSIMQQVFLKTNLALQKGLPAAACSKLIHQSASISLGDTIKKLSTYLLALLCRCIQSKFGTDIQRITTTPANDKI